MTERSDEPKASDLIGEPEPEADPPHRKLGVRRVTGWSTSNRLLARTARRPVGNSTAFWSRIEDDDPFARRPAPEARHLADHEVYPVGRLERIEKVKIEKGRVVPTRQPDRPPPQLRQEASPQPRSEVPPRPRPPERPSQPAETTQPPPRTRPKRDTSTAERPPIDRRPPIIKKGGSKKSGRVRIGRTPRQASTDRPPAKTAAEIRAEKEAARKSTEPKEPPQLRNLDGVLSALGALAAAQGIFEENQERKERGEPLLGEPTVTGDPRPAPPPPESPRPKTKPKPAAKPPVDRRPPKPPPAKKAAAPPAPPRHLATWMTSSGPAPAKVACVSDGAVSRLRRRPDRPAAGCCLQRTLRDLTRRDRQQFPKAGETNGSVSSQSPPFSVKPSPSSS